MNFLQNILLNNGSFGIGTDIESISRFKEVKNNERFLNKIFTKKEIDYCFSKKNPCQHLAARFAGKEAVIKALSNLVNSFSGYKEIEIINNESGGPLVNLTHKNSTKFNIKLSLSHCEDKAIAFAVIVGKKQ